MVDVAPEETKADGGETEERETEPEDQSHSEIMPSAPAPVAESPEVPKDSPLNFDAASVYSDHKPRDEWYINGLFLMLQNMYSILETLKKILKIAQKVLWGK